MENQEIEKKSKLPLIIGLFIGIITFITILLLPKKKKENKGNNSDELILNDIGELRKELKIQKEEYELSNTELKKENLKLKKDLEDGKVNEDRRSKNGDVQSGKTKEKGKTKGKLKEVNDSDE